MQNAMRRTLGVTGATAVAIGATLALAGAADAHTPTFATGCLDNGQAVLSVDLKYYTQPKKNGQPNTITVSYTPNGGTAKVVLPVTDFNTTLSIPTTTSPDPLAVDGTTAGTYSITITAWDDANGQNSVAKVGPDKAWDGTWTKTTTVCPQSTQTTPPTQTTQPTVPPTQPPTTTTTAPPVQTTTSQPAVAAAAPGSTPPGGLAYTGVSAELPLIIGGALIVIGAGALFGMRLLSKRRRTQD